VGHYVFVGPGAVPPYARDYAALIGDHPRHDPGVPMEITDDAALYFTSGTTGTPKGALLTHRNLEAACIVENHHHRQTHADNFLCMPPLYHTGAKMHWFGNFIVGARAVILRGIEPRWILEAVSEEQVTVVWLLVPWAMDILFAIESGELKLRDFNLDQWRLMHIGAQPVPPSLIKEWLKIFPHHQYDTNYGLTESTGPGCIHLGVENIHKVGAIGRPASIGSSTSSTTITAPVPAGRARRAGDQGTGRHEGYYRNPEATAQALKNGWLLTGDIARLDPDGFIWLVDRKKDVIITGGENVYPVEIEDFLQHHPKIPGCGRHRPAQPAPG
jgi:fatty-acyl-CoA synthase